VMNVTGAATFATPTTGNITLDSSNHFFSTVSIKSGNNVALKDADAINLGASTISGTLKVTSLGAITDSGVLNVKGASYFEAGAANDITLDSNNHLFSAVQIASGNNVTLKDADTIDLGAITIGGTLKVTSAGAITDSGVLNVTGLSTFDAGAANNITLDNNNHLFSSVQIASGNHVTIKDLDTIDLGASTINGTLKVTSAGAITDSGVLKVTGASTFEAGIANNITLDTSNHLFSSVQIISGNNVTLKDADAIDLGASTISGTLKVTSAGSITDSGVLKVTGVSTFDAGAPNNITLDNNNHLFSSVQIVSANNVALKDADAIDLGACRA